MNNLRSLTMILKAAQNKLTSNLPFNTILLAMTDVAATLNPQTAVLPAVAVQVEAAQMPPHLITAT